MLKEILRLLISLIFIASGFVKAVDVKGFSFKLEEYFSPTVFNMPFFEANALPIAILVVILELILGFMLLLKIQVKKVLIMMIGLCIFFAFLTFYSAYFNKVTDCGCFGDAIKFTPWQSFFKDIAILLGLIILWFAYKRYNFKTEKVKNFSKIILGVLAVLSGMVIVHGILHEPLIDFRDYKIGTDLKAEKKKISENPSEYKTFYTIKNAKTGEEIKVNQDDYVNKEEYWKEGSPWKILEGKNESKLMKEGYQSEILKFNIEDPTTGELTEQILNAPKAILLFSYAPDKADKNLIAKTEKKLSEMKDAFVLGVSTNPNTFKTIKNAMMDGTAIKTVARSNPFVLILQNGKITDKQSAEDYVK